jgi:hypothetical protein
MKKVDNVISREASIPVDLRERRQLWPNGLERECVSPKDLSAITENDSLIAIK